jgi:hypothetical protein
VDLSRQLIWFPWIVGAIVKACIVVAVGIYTILAFRSLVKARNRTSQFVDEHSSHRDKPPRVVCHGGPEFFEPFGPIQEVPFGPQVRWGTLAVEYPWRVRLLLWIVGSCLFLYLILYVNPLGAMRGLAGYGALGASAGIILLACNLIAPVFLRATPGRLEILWYALWWPRAVRHQVFSLIDLPVVIDLRTQVIRIGPPESATWISLMLIRNGAEFAYYVLLGSLASEPGKALDTLELGG